MHNPAKLLNYLVHFVDSVSSKIDIPGKKKLQRAMLFSPHMDCLNHHPYLSTL